MSYDTWDVVLCPSNFRPVGCKWVFAIEEHSDGSIARYKARLVAQGFIQTEGVDFDEVFSPVAKYTSIRVFLAIIGQFGFVTRQLDFVKAFLNVRLQEKIYMRLPQGHQVPHQLLQSQLVCRLKGGLYGLKQSAREWHLIISQFLLSLGFEKSTIDPCIFKISLNNELLYLAIDVDDIIIASSSQADIDLWSIRFHLVTE